MGYGFVGPGHPDEAYLLPPDVRDWLPPRHLAWALLEETGRMDLSAFTRWYRAGGQGRPAYHPAMMVALIGYCYCKGIRSSRAVEAATFDDLGARVICGNLHPDHATVARFITRHEQAVRGLLAASVTACAREGLVSVDVVAGDGTKIRASAPAAANVSLEGLDAQIAGLEELVAAEVEAWIAQARAEDAVLGMLGGDDGGDDGGAAAPGDRGRRRTAVTLARRRAARAALAAAEQARQQQAEAERAGRITRLEARAARAGETAARLEARAAARVADYERRAVLKAEAGSRRRPDGRVPVAAGDQAHVRRARRGAGRAQAQLEAALAEPADPGRPGKISTTDPASKMMQAKNGGYGQQHNVQVLAGRRQVIYAIASHPGPVDVTALHPLLDKGRATLDAAGITGKLGVILFDAGYASDANFTAPCEGDLHVAVTREARQTGRLKDGRKPRTMKKSRQQMAARLDSGEGKAACRQRAAIIEPVFAQLFSRLGRDLHYRGARADLELHLWAATHNLLKAIRASARRPAADPAIQAA
jgi:transposase